MQISSQATEWLRCTVLVDGTAPPPTDPVAFAFLTQGWPTASTSWEAGSWDAGKARILIGPGGLVLPVDTYRVFLRVTDNPEIPVRPVGSLTVH